MDDGKTKSIKYSQVRKWWSYANQLDIEWCQCKVSRNRVAFAMTTASGQGGVFCIWNCETDTLEHISEASYISDFEIKDKYLYSLHEITNYMMPYHYRVFRTKLGVLDAWNSEFETLYADEPQKIGACKELELIIEGKKMLVKTEQSEFVFAKDYTKALKPQKEYQYLYDTPDQSDPEYEEKVIKRRGMLF